MHIVFVYTIMNTFAQINDNLLYNANDGEIFCKYSNSCIDMCRYVNINGLLW